MRPPALMRGPSAKPMPARVEPAPLQARDLHQGEDSRARGAAGGLQPGAHEGAVLAREGHDVRHRADGHDVQVGPERLHAAQGLHELCRHAHARKVRERVAAKARVDHRAVRQLVRGVVVVRDDDVQPQLPAEAHLPDRGDAAVHRQQQVVLGREAADGGLVQAVALAVAVRDVVADGEADLAQIEHEQGGRGHAVGVVVAVDADALLFRLGPPDAVHRLAHPAQQEGVVQVVQRGVEVGARGPLVPRCREGP